MTALTAPRRMGAAISEAQPSRYLWNRRQSLRRTLTRLAPNQSRVARAIESCHRRTRQLSHGLVSLPSKNVNETLNRRPCRAVGFTMDFNESSRLGALDHLLGGYKMHIKNCR